MLEKKQNEQIKLTQMQEKLLALINDSKKEVSPTYLANMYYESIGKRRYASSRYAFGQTSAAYRTCRTLAKLGLVNKHEYTTKGGYSYIMFQRK